MNHLFAQYWGLIFPIMWFAFSILRCGSVTVAARGDSQNVRSARALIRLAVERVEPQVEPRRRICQSRAAETGTS
ncbi:MAG TPA: hypothetical protein VMV25_01935 [Steroidobacteraceae bacterium]|nr:hypothetical protein [Steroidobacteraceae bacterium]